MHSILDSIKVLDSIRFYKEAKIIIREFKESLPDKIDAPSDPRKSQLPFGVDSLRTALLYRITDLSNAACLLFDSQMTIPGFVMTRATLETSAMLFWLWKKVNNVAETGQVGDLHKFVMKATFGTKDKNLPFEAFNVLTAIDQVVKETDTNNYREMYDFLSEFTHPNFAGTQIAYISYTPGTYLVEFGMQKGMCPTHIGLTALCVGVALFKLKSEEIDTLMPKLEVIGDADWERRSKEKRN